MQLLIGMMALGLPVYSVRLMETPRSGVTVTNAEFTPQEVQA
jgi:hypothetical protein